MKTNKSFNERNIADDLDRILRVSDPALPDSLRPDNMVSRIKREHQPAAARSFSAISYRRWMPIAASCAACLILTVLFFFHPFGMHTFQKSSNGSSVYSENVKPNANATKTTQEADGLVSGSDSLTNDNAGEANTEDNYPQDTVYDDVQHTNSTAASGKGTSANASKSPTRNTNAGNTTKGSGKPSASSTLPGSNSSDICGITKLSIDETEAREMIEAGALVIDLRTSAEYEAGHIETAVNIPFDRLAADIASVAHTGKTVIVYHNTCEQSMDAALALRNLQYDAYSLGAYNAAWIGALTTSQKNPK